jgi:hypothetical protein
MSDPQTDDILDETLRPAERAALLETANRLDEARPVPRPAFRGRLARQLGARPTRPERIRVLISAYAGSGLLLLAVVAVGLAGIGPLAST